MPLPVISPDLVKLALPNASGQIFEKFSMEYLSALMGVDFRPVGGPHDGGVDGWLDEGIYKSTRSERVFAQASVERGWKGKITKTMARLMATDRVPEKILYITSQVVKDLDKVEIDLSRELGADIRIYDAQYIANHVNTSAQTIASFEHHLRPLTEWLRAPGAAPLIAASSHVTSPAVYVFLSQELERRSGQTRMIDAVTDALCLWALEGTDPATGKLMTREDVLARICFAIPTAKDFVAERLTDRLKFLCEKARQDGRIRFYRDRDAYCLPLTTRSRIEAENLEDETLRLAMLDSLRRRIADSTAGVFAPDEADLAAEVAVRALQLLFEQEGLEFSAFIANTEAKARLETVQDALRAALTDSRVQSSQRERIGEGCLYALRGVLQASTDEERLYLGKLARTYALLFTLQAEPRLVAYFDELTADFYLYVGTDVLVSALSERYLAREDQQYRNVLRLAAEAGTKLILAEPVLNETISHLRSSDHEFRAYFAKLAGISLPDAEAQSPRPLVRAYFQALENPDTMAERPKSWPDFINRFVDYAFLHERGGLNDLKGYLLNQFHMEFQSSTVLRGLVDGNELEEWTAVLAAIKKERSLASNDALMALAVYGRRTALGEEGVTTEFGYRTWWLSSESRILGLTRPLTDSHGGSRYMLKPDFLLNFLALAPSAADVQIAYRNIFPTILGMQLAKRMDEGVFQTMMMRVNEIDDVEPGRRKTQMSRLINDLMSDFRKEHLHRFRFIAPEKGAVRATT